MNKIETIDEFEFFVGGYFGINFNVEYKSNNIFFARNDTFSKCNRTKKEISSNDLQIFIDKLNSLNVIDWKNKYMNNVYDGEEWTLSIVYNDGKKIDIYGLMQYPGNKLGNTNRSKAFKDLLLFIKNLISEPTFFT